MFYYDDGYVQVKAGRWRSRAERVGRLSVGSGEQPAERKIHNSRTTFYIESYFDGGTKIENKMYRPTYNSVRPNLS